MRSSEKMLLTEIERDLPTTHVDVVRLRFLRSAGPANPFEALQHLVDALPAPARQQRRTTAAGRPEFEI